MKKEKKGGTGWDRAYVPGFQPAVFKREKAAFRWFTGITLIKDSARRQTYQCPQFCNKKYIYRITMYILLKQ